MEIHFLGYLLIGLFSGTMSGMFGIGGGTVRIPLLNLAGLPLLSAFGINFFVIPFSSLVGAMSQRKNIAKEIVIYAIVGGVLGEIIGAIFVGFIPTLILAIIFVTLCFIVAFGIHLSKIVPKLAQKLKPTKKNIFGSSFLAYSFKIITLFVMVGLMGFLYLIITMETKKDLLEQCRAV